MGVGANVVAAMIMHRVDGTKLLVGSMFCYTISAVLGATQPPGTIYWAMSFPAMGNLTLDVFNCSYWCGGCRSE
jgi:hypothetical protein